METRKPETVDEIEAGLVAKIKDLVQMSKHDVAHLNSLLNSLSDSMSYLPGIVEKESLSTVCADVNYYTTKLERYALCLETLHKIKNSYNNDKNRIRKTEGAVGGS